MTPALPSVFLAPPLAHRGLHDRDQGVIENSRGAVAAAVDAGYGIEIDLQLAADGEAMVFHDDELMRLVGRPGPVAAHDAAALGRMTLSGSDETIPTLAEILDLVRGEVPLLVELKDQSRTLGPVDGRLERRAARLLAAYSGPIAVMSFNPESVAILRDEAPSIPRGRVTCPFTEREWSGVASARREALARMDDLDVLKCGFISHLHTDLSGESITMAKSTGRPVLCWTVRSGAEEAAARRFADNVTFEGYAA
ncbi:MAG: glycerophosphodiester phosphodiesterase family protein [Pseudomonadota bacterium]